MAALGNEQPVVAPFPEVGEVGAYGGPPLVYGLDNLDGMLMVVPREWAERAANELDRWPAARTWREGLTVAAQVTVLVPPFSPHEKREELGEEDLDEPFTASWKFDYVDYGDDGTFPTVPSVKAAATVPEEWAVGEMGGYCGDGLYIEPAEEPVARICAGRRGGAGAR